MRKHFLSKKFIKKNNFLFYRLYSDYLYFEKKNKKSIHEFHKDARQRIIEWRNCTSLFSERKCAYEHSRFVSV